MKNRPLIRFLLVSLLIIPLLGCRNEGAVMVPVSSQTSSLLTKRYDDNFHPRYDINGTKGEYIMERVGLYPREASGIDPAISLIDPRARAAITYGDSCLRMTLTNVENTWMDFFYYRLEADPNYASDSERPDCWEDGNDSSAWGQDWSQYTHLMCDMWINPEKPIHNHKGWWASIGLFTEMGNTTDLWAQESGQANNSWWDTYYWTHKGGTGNPKLGPMKLAWRFAVGGANAAANAGNARWTRLGHTAFMSFILGGDQINMVFGGELYIDNIRVVRLSKPFWESFDHMAEHLAYNESSGTMSAIGISDNAYCYSPCHPDYDQWLAARPHGGARDEERALTECP